mgnify:CR=1 FL=1
MVRPRAAKPWIRAAGVLLHLQLVSAFFFGSPDCPELEEADCKKHCVNKFYIDNWVSSVLVIVFISLIALTLSEVQEIYVGVPCRLRHERS